MNNHLVAVYGSLRHGFGNWRRFLKDRAEKIKKTTVSGFQMNSLGSYPGIVPGRKNQKVVVELFEVSDEVLKDLDYLEGHPNFYIRTPVTTDTGEAVEIYVIARHAALRHYPVVESGDWAKVCA